MRDSYLHISRSVPEKALTRTQGKLDFLDTESEQQLFIPRSETMMQKKKKSQPSSHELKYNCRIYKLPQPLSAMLEVKLHNLRNVFSVILTLVITLFF